MYPNRLRFSVKACLLMGLLLISAQAVALKHVYEHDQGAPQNLCCDACVTMQQVESVVVATFCIPQLEVIDVPPLTRAGSGAMFSHVCLVRQRGPPSFF